MAVKDKLISNEALKPVYDNLNGKVDDLKSHVGTLSSLHTEDKDSLVEAINEVNDRFPEGIEAAVDDWLDDHPEATTTIQDHSLTHIKLVNGTLGFVTPEMYGAVGDGVADDTVAIQNAVDAGFNVRFEHGKQYKITASILVNSHQHIDGNGATIVNSGTYRCIGKKTAIIDDVVLKNISFVGSGASDTSGTWPNINSGIVIATDATNIKVANCNFRNFRYGVFIGGEGGEHAYIENCSFNNCKQAIATFAEEDGIIYGCVFNGCEVAIGLETNDSVTTNNFRISNNRVFNSTGSENLQLHNHLVNVIVEGNILDGAIVTGHTDITNLQIYNNVIGRNNYIGGDFKLCNNIINGITEIPDYTNTNGLVYGNYIEAMGTNEDAFNAYSNVKFINNTAKVSNAFLVGGNASGAFIVGLRLLSGSIARSVQWSKIVFYDYCGVATPSNTNYNNKIDTDYKYWIPSA